MSNSRKFLGKKMYMSQQVILGKANIPLSEAEQDCIPVKEYLCPALELGQNTLGILQVVEKSHFYEGAFLKSSR